MIWILTLLLLLRQVDLVAVPRQKRDAPTVDLEYAKYRGVYEENLNVNSFYGIRYAQPPTEQLRWRPPQPIEKALDHSEPSILNATTRGPSCVQGQAFWQNPSMLPFKPDGAEDCLLLDVVQPAGIEQTANLPVIVQIHGGCYIHLDSQSFTGYALMKHSQNSIIYISIQYRLGAYGFLYSDELGQEGSANLGLQDQRYALQWIKRHISAFGGDPGKVTIMGGSAGGASVTNQMILYGGAEAPLFRAAIAEYPWWPPYLAKKQLLKQYKKLLTAANCTDMSCLRSLDEDSLALAAQTTFITGYGDYGYGNCYYGPYVDGLVVQDYPSKEFEKGNYVKVPVILDRERFEGYTFTNTSMTTIEEETEDLKIQFPGADEGFVEEVLSLYPREDFNSTFFQRQTWFGDIYIDCPTYYVASSMSSAGLPVWKMLFETGSQKHGATVPYLFDVNYGSSPSDNADYAFIMKDWILSFAVTLNPNSQSWSGLAKPYWPVYRGGEVVTVTDAHIQTGGDPDAGESCRFFQRETDVVQN